ncbi:MAG: alpha/beta hydrolase-fold protein [Bacteroidales bacterium]
MKNRFSFALILLFLLNSLVSNSQVTFIINSLPASTPDGSSFYIAGSFNNWNPGDDAYKLVLNSSSKPEITLPPGTGSIEFKFTRGSWESCEGTSGGGQIANRNFTYGNGQTVQISIAGWEDNGGGSGGSTAASNVHIISDNFEMPQLNRTRRVWIYLPPDYETSGKNYPVLYMHDGQNVFDIKTSYAGEWKVDESLNHLFADHYEVPIVVAVDNGGGLRIDELSPWRNPNYGGGDGEKYMEFMVETLKPYIDQNYRTQTNASSTALMGSSLGGFISHYAMLAYPEIYSKYGIFSPAYWFSDSVVTSTQTEYQAHGRVYMMAGDNEGEGVVQDMQQMADILRNKGLSADDLHVKVVPGGQHNEALWQSQFEEAIIWLFRLSPGIPEKEIPKTGYWYPNPASEELFFKVGTSNQFPQKIDFINQSGSLVKSIENEIHFPINISELCQGNYIIHAIFSNSIVNQKFMKD